MPAVAIRYLRASFGVKALCLSLGVAPLAILLSPTNTAHATNPSPSPSANSQVITTAGTSFLTAETVEFGQQITAPSSTGDYMYWSFNAQAGDVSTVKATISLPPSANRHGPSRWGIDIFDGLRRRQACTKGAQTPVANTADTTVILGCTLPQVRSWAEPWSSDPLPGTYYVRLSATDLPEQDLGLPIRVDMMVTGSHDDDPKPEGGTMKAPVVPAGNPGSAKPGEPSPLPSTADGDDEDRWLPELSSRWLWTGVGGLLAALMGFVGYAFTRQPITRFIR